MGIVTSQVQQLGAPLESLGVASQAFVLQSSQDLRESLHELQMIVYRNDVADALSLLQAIADRAAAF